MIERGANRRQRADVKLLPAQQQIRIAAHRTQARTRAAERAGGAGDQDRRSAEATHAVRIGPAAITASTLPPTRSRQKRMGRLAGAASSRAIAAIAVGLGCGARTSHGPGS